MSISSRRSRSRIQKNKRVHKDKEKKNYINIGRDEEDPDSDNILFDDKEIGENDDGKIHSNH